MNIETRDFAPHVVRTGWNEQQGARTVRVALVVDFGLHHIKGNRQPHFSITATGYENGKDSFGGCCHEIIAERFPELNDMISLHLSGMDGTPMHAEGNGFYWLAGMVGGMGQQYHGGNSEPAKSATDCARIFSNHARVTEAEAWQLAGRINKLHKDVGRKEARAEFKAWTDAQRPRWKAEADAAIRKYGLGIYGHMHKTPAEVAAMLELAAA